MDLAAMPERTALASIEWARTRAVVRDLVCPADDGVILGVIGQVALRCAVLLAKLDASGRPVDRSGAGAVVEVYPAASLRGWGLRHRGYKRPRTPEVLAVAADDLLAAAPWLDCGPHEETIRR